jgi:hypothetical protein
MFGTPIYGITPMEPNRKSRNLNEHLCYRILQLGNDFYLGLKVTMDNYIYDIKNWCKQPPCNFSVKYLS